MTASRRGLGWRCRARSIAAPSAATASSASCASSSAGCGRTCARAATSWWRARRPPRPTARRCARAWKRCCAGPARCPPRPRTAQCPAPVAHPPTPDHPRRIPPANEPACPMNQTRTLLIFAWLMVAMLLWMEWRKEANVEASPEPPVPAELRADGSVPSPKAAEGGASVPVAPTAPLAPPADGAAPAPEAAASATVQGDRITVVTDVLRLTLESGNVIDAALLGYPQTRDEDSPPVKLLETDPARWYAAQSGWVSQAQAAPTHEAGFVAAADQREYRLTEDGEEVVVPFVWRGPDGVDIQRTITVRRGSYAIDVRDTVVNASGEPWQGFVYRQLSRVPPRISRGMTKDRKSVV